MADGEGALMQLRRQLKEWERSFAEVHGRRPASSDVNADPSIKDLYNKYASLKRHAGKENVPPPSQNQGECVGSFDAKIPHLNGTAKSNLNIEKCSLPDLSKAVPQNILKTDVDPFVTSSCDPSQNKRKLELDGTSDAPVAKRLQPLFPRDFNSLQRETSISQIKIPGIPEVAAVCTTGQPISSSPDIPKETPSEILKEATAPPTCTQRTMNEEGPLKIFPQGFTISIQRCGERLDTGLSSRRIFSTNEWTARLDSRISSRLANEQPPGVPENPSADSTSKSPGNDEVLADTAKTAEDPATPNADDPEKKSKPRKPRDTTKKNSNKSSGNFVKLNLHGKGKNMRKFVSRACCKRPSAYGRKKWPRKNRS